ncbi:MAG: GNAT family N-acetyltransferase [Erysipelotrichales bacterium]
MVIETERLLLRNYNVNDSDDLYEIYKDEETCRYLLHEAWTDKTRQQEFIKKLLSSDLINKGHISLGCFLDDKVIGDISIWSVSMKDTMEIGFVFNKEYRNHGYASEAINSLIEYLFNELNIHRLKANLDARNKESEQLCKRVGMRQEAYFIQDFWSKGEWTSSCVYGFIKDDLNKKNGNL